jgi:protein-L-isoaspartate(D-aspartate) O-methyltransferase
MNFSASRLRMVKEQLISRGIKDQRLLNVMGEIPRHLFILEALRSTAYGNHPLPIGEGQTISQPYVTALMVEALELNGTEKILEIGTGSGYQTAVLAKLVEKVYSIERITSLALKARKLIESLHYINILIRVADGSYGWSENAPFDRIIISAASPTIPEPLLDQLKDKGIMIIPLGTETSQTLVKVIKEGERKRVIDISPCLFVKMIGQHGWKN